MQHHPIPDIPHTASCFANHMGYWLIEPRWLAQAVAHIRAGTWTPEARHLGDGEDLFEMAADGVAVVPISGPMMKGRSKFGGASTIDTRRALRQAVATEEVRGILVHVDSPGGHVAGTQDLADDVFRLRAQKPIHAHIDDLGGSAALWVASQATTVTANATALIGSVGIIGVLEDSSGKAEAEGVKVHVVTTGDQKAAGIPGVPVTDEMLESEMETVRDLFGHFMGSLRRARKLSAAQVEAVSDGRVVIAQKARDLGLIDRVGTLTDALAGFPRRPRRQKAEADMEGLKAKARRRHA